MPERDRFVDFCRVGSTFESLENGPYRDGVLAGDCRVVRVTDRERACVATRAAVRVLCSSCLLHRPGIQASPRLKFQVV